MPTLITEADVAERLGITLRTMRSWRSSGLAPDHFRVNGIIRYSEDAVADWIADNTRNGGVSDDLNAATKGRIDAEASAAH